MYKLQALKLAENLYKEFNITIHHKKRGWGIGSKKYLIPELAQFIQDFIDKEYRHKK